MNMDPVLASNRHLGSVRCDILAAGYLAITNFLGSMYMGHAFTLHHTVLLSQGGLMAHLGEKNKWDKAKDLLLKSEAAVGFDGPGFGTGLQAGVRTF